MEVMVRDFSIVIKKFERACKRSNCTYTLLRTEIVKDPDNPGEVKVYNIYDVSEPYTDPDHEGFKVLKRFDHVENITKTVLGEDTESNNEYLAKCKCDDCGKDIKSRRFSYLLERLIDGTKMQVGSSCLKKYANKKAVDGFFDLPNSFDFDDDEERDCIPSSYDVDTALTVLIKEFRNYTWYNDFKYDFTVDAFSFACAIYEKDEEAEALAKKLKEYILNMDATNEWARNLVQIMRNGYFSKTNYGYVRSAVTLLKHINPLETLPTVSLERGNHEITITKLIRIERIMYDNNKIHALANNGAYMVIEATTNTANRIGRMIDNNEEVKIEVFVRDSSTYNGVVYNFANKIKFTTTETVRESPNDLQWMWDLD